MSKEKYVVIYSYIEINEETIMTNEIQDVKLFTSEKDAKDFILGQANAHLFCDENNEVIVFKSYDEAYDYQQKHYENINHIYTIHAVEENNNGRWLSHHQWMLDTTRNNNLVVSNLKKDAVDEQVTYRAFGKIRHLSLNSDKTIVYHDDFSDDEVINAIENEAFNIVDDDYVKVTITPSFADDEDYDEDTDNGLPFNFNIKLHHEDVSYDEYDKRLKLFDTFNEFDDFFEMDGDDPLCTGTLFDALSWAVGFEIENNMEDAKKQDIFNQIKQYMETLVGSRWSVESLSKHLSDKFGLDVELNDIDEEGLLHDYALLWGIFEEWGYVDIYYLKMPYDKTGTGDTIYITEVSVSKE